MRLAAVTLCSTALALATGALLIVPALSGAQQDPLPPAHPPLNPTRPATPPGHPAIPTDAPEARPADVADPGAVVHAYYETISGPAGTERDWGRFRSLFLPSALLVATSQGDEPVVLTPGQFVDVNRNYFAGGYHERAARERIDSFGHVAQVWSTYESRRRTDGDPYSRGINAFQLVETKGRWWIAHVAWDRERSTAPLPEAYLP